MIIVIYLMTGIFAGLAAGLLGVGGGLIVGPILILCFEREGFSALVLTHMAIATSLATIVFTSLSSIYNHHRLGTILWPMFKPMGLGIVVGAILGVLTVVQIDGQILKKLLGVFAVIVSLRMWFANQGKGLNSLPRNNILLGFGVLVGWVSSIFGIGGGTLTVPFLSRYQVQMKQAIGTAAACGFPIAAVSSVTNGVVGLDIANRPEWSLGYIYLPALLCIVITSVYFAKVGAGLASRMSSSLLRNIFAAMLLLVGIHFLAS